MCGWGAMGPFGFHGWFPGFGGLLAAGLLLLGGLAVWQLVRARSMPGTQASLACPECEGPVLPAYFRCPACGRSLKSHCPGCSAVIETRWKYCPHCSQVLKPAQPATSA
jgi:hypothetical protein